MNRMKVNHPVVVDVEEDDREEASDSHAPAEDGDEDAAAAAVPGPVAEDGAGGDEDEDTESRRDTFYSPFYHLIRFFSSIIGKQSVVMVEQAGKLRD